MPPHIFNYMPNYHLGLLLNNSLSGTENTTLGPVQGCIWKHQQISVVLTPIQEKLLKNIIESLFFKLIDRRWFIY